jgi:hypothetical protein
LSKGFQVGDEAKVCALIEEKPHRAACCLAPFFGSGDTLSPVTIACA